MLRVLFVIKYLSQVAEQLLQNSRPLLYITLIIILISQSSYRTHFTKEAAL